MELTTEQMAMAKLCAAVVAQAVEDYRAMEKAGWILNGRCILPEEVAKEQRFRRRRDIYANRSTCVGLIHFFRPGGAMDELIDVAVLNISGNAIRDKLGLEFTEETDVETSPEEKVVELKPFYVPL